MLSYCSVHFTKCYFNMTINLLLGHVGIVTRERDVLDVHRFVSGHVVVERKEEG